MDYYKFFDSFDLRFFAQLLVAVGIDQGLVDLFESLNTNAVRRIKIGNTYGPELRPYNALGQGDPFALLAALVYVHGRRRR